MTKLYQISEIKEAAHKQSNCLKDAEIARLRKRLSGQYAYISELEEELDELKATMAKYNDEEAV